MPLLVLRILNVREHRRATASPWAPLPPLCPLQGMPPEDQHHHCLDRAFQKAQRKRKSWRHRVPQVAAEVLRGSLPSPLGDVVAQKQTPGPGREWSFSLLLLQSHEYSPATLT